MAWAFSHGERLRMKLRYSSLHRFGADSLVLGSFAAILAARSALPCELPVMWCLALVVATEALQLTTGEEQAPAELRNIAYSTIC